MMRFSLLASLPVCPPNFTPTSSEGSPATATDGAGTLESITVWGSRYPYLLAPASMTEVNDADLCWIGGTAPSSGEDALKGLDLDTHVLNSSFKVQFRTTLTTNDVLFIFSANDRAWDGGTVQALDSGGGMVGTPYVAERLALAAGQISPVLEARTFNRSGDRTLAARAIYGAAFTLADMGVASETTITGFAFTNTKFAPAIVGLAAETDYRKGTVVVVR